MGITSLVVRQKEFKTRFRGFDVQEVDGFLEEVAIHLESMDRLIEKLMEEKNGWIWRIRDTGSGKMP